MTDPKPMDPARLAALDHEASLMRVSMIPDSVLVVGQLIRELIEAHGYWHDEAKRLTNSVFGIKRDRDSAAEGLRASRILLATAQAEGDRFRARCTVTAEDVETAGVTREQAVALLRSWGWTPLGLDRYQWEVWRDDDGELVDVSHVKHGCGTEPLRLSIAYIAEHVGRPAFDILDEMAALTVADGEAP